MKALFNLSLFILGLIIVSCKQIINSSKKEMVVSKLDTMVNNSKTAPLKVNNNPQITLIRNFLKWYQLNYIEINSISLVDLKEDSLAAQYEINLKNIERYLDIFKKSGYVSEVYINNMRDYFKKANENLLKTKQNDGPPEGFESDLVLFTQEPEDILKHLNSIKIEQISINKCKVHSLASDLIFTLKFQNGNFLIDKIAS